MSVTNNLKNLPYKFLTALRISTPPYVENVVKTRIPPLSCVTSHELTNKKILQHESGLTNFYNTQGEIMPAVIPKLDVPVLKKIIEPEKIIKLEIPLRNITNKEIDLPCNVEKDMVEPTDHIVSKHAINMIRIRARKMRKHRRRKLLKKIKFVLRKLNLKRKQEKEKKFQSELQVILMEAQNYNAEKYVKNTLDTIHWEKPVTKVRGLLAPDWVIKEELQKKRESKLLRERTEECLKYKKF